MSIPRKIIHLLLTPYRKKRKKSRTDRIVKELLSSNQDLKIELGSGDIKGIKGWTTIDQHSECDISWDLRDGIPFPDNSISIVYSSHLFEHLTYKEARGLFKECLRVLKPNGEISICVPDAKPYVEAYIRKDSNFFISRQSVYKPAFNDSTHIDILNYVAYMDGEHKYLFDQENLLNILQANGFTEVESRNFSPDLDKIERDHESIYARGFKK